MGCPVLDNVAGPLDAIFAQGMDHQEQARRVCPARLLSQEPRQFRHRFARVWSFRWSGISSRPERRDLDNNPKASIEIGAFDGLLSAGTSSTSIMIWSKMALNVVRSSGSPPQQALAISTMSGGASTGNEGRTPISTADRIWLGLVLLDHGSRRESTSQTTIPKL